MKISLCLLTWNELDGCKADIPKIPFEIFDQVYSIDGGSTDGTIEYLEQNNIEVINQTKSGYNQAYIDAFDNCKTDAVVFFHPKGSVDPSCLNQFPEFFEKGYDLVVASRNMKGGRNEEDSSFWRPRKWFVFWLGILIYLIWSRKGYLVGDVLHGLRGMIKKKFYEIDPLQEGLSIDLEMIIRSYRKSFKRIEFPVKESPRLSGETHFKAFKTGKKLLKYLLKELMRTS